MSALAVGLARAGREGGIVLPRSAKSPTPKASRRGQAGACAFTGLLVRALHLRRLKPCPWMWYTHPVSMHEPYLSEFKRMIRAGASNQDIHDSGNSDGYASTTGVADDLYIQREVDRVASHQLALTPLLKRYVGCALRILDFGCGTGGSTVAMSLSGLGADQIIGVDANPSAVAAARVRAKGYELAPPRLTFTHVEAGAALPYPDGWFDLVVTVSVLEFITAAADRDAVVAELRRVVAPGGFLYVATPRPRLREYHSGALLGDARRVPGMPWASPPWQVRAWGDGWLRVNLSEHFASRVTRRLPWLPAGAVSMVLGPVLPLAGAWQKALFRRLDG